MKGKTFPALKLFLLFLSLFLLGCHQKENGVEETAGITLIFKHGKIAGDPEELRQLLDRFEKENPGITVKDETLPASTDEQHQFYAINLEGKSSDFDVLSMDVIWVPEFARAGWLKDITRLLPEDEQRAFFPGPLEAVTYRNKIYAVPWYIDAGVLYYRKDLLEKHGSGPPKTWRELVDTAGSITAKEKGLYGFIWQGKQYEGLVCNVLEYFWSNGGDVLKDGRAVIDSPQNAEALRFMKDLIFTYRVTPDLVLNSIEEPTRHIFGNGRALFMRNWPYAWNIFEKEGSPVKGKVGVSLLPAFSEGRSASTLGGWQLGINRFSKNPEAAEKLITFLTSPAAQKTLALTVGYKPTRKALYRDADLIEKQPFMVSLYEVFMNARPRPVSPYYMMMTQIMQPEFSAAISDIKPAGEALRAIQSGFEKVISE